MNVTLLEWIAGVVGTVFLGALGSGLWDVLFKKWYGILTRITLQVITLGYRASRDTLYLEAAKGHNDRATLWIIYITALFALPQILLSQPFWYGPTSTEALRTLQQAEAVAAPHTDNELQSMSKEQLQALKDKILLAKKASEDSDRERIIKLKRDVRMLATFEKFRWFMVVAYLVIFLSILVRAIRINFISRIITDYQQRYDICRPFLAEGDQLMIKSRFAQMQNGEEYAKIMYDLKSAIALKNLQMPTTFLSQVAPTKRQSP